jgi:hypothetical protein
MIANALDLSGAMTLLRQKKRHRRRVPSALIESFTRSVSVASASLVVYLLAKILLESPALPLVTQKQA